MALQDELVATRRSGTASSARRVWPSRWDLVAAWAVILLPTLVILALLLPRQRVGDLEERLIRDVNALYSRTNTRSVHVDAASPGAIGDAVVHLLPVVQAAKVLEKDGGYEQMRQVVSGAADIGSLRPSVVAALASVGPDLDALLAATHAERANFAEPFDAEAGSCAIAWQHVATFTGVRMRLVLAAGESRRAFREGLDGLALGRDVAIAGSLLGHMIGAAIVTRLAPAVAAALDALHDPADRQDAIRRLRAIRGALPAFSRTVADDAVLGQLLIGEVIPVATRTRLDPRARAVILRDGLRNTSVWQRLWIRDGWRDLRTAQDQVIATADLPDAERAAAWKEVGFRVKRLANPFATISLLSYDRYALRAEATVRLLDALVLAGATGVFRDVRSRWPGSVEELTSVGELEPAEAERLAHAELEIDAELEGLNLVVPLPRADDKEPGDIHLLLRGPAGKAN